MISEPRPAWLRVSYNPHEVEQTSRILGQLGLRTVCTAASCPNIGECYRRRTATFLILGEHCTRACRFCDVPTGVGDPLDREEPARLAQAAARLGLRHVVVTCVTRDDLPDGGAGQFVAVTRALREALPDAAVELLISDFDGSRAALDEVLAASPDVLGHNMETVRRLTPSVRARATYERSLGVLARARENLPRGLVKTGFMLGLGETREEVLELLADIRATGCDIVTISQYLPPSPAHAPLVRYVPPEEFEELREAALEMGFRGVIASPLARSSYHADEAFASAKERAGQ